MSDSSSSSKTTVGITLKVIKWIFIIIGLLTILGFIGIIMDGCKTEDIIGPW